MRLEGMRIAVLAAEGVEDLEYWVTVMRLREEGAHVTSVGVAPGTVHGKHGLPLTVEAAAADLDAATVDALVVPGGWAPDKLRRYAAVTDLVAAVDAARKPIAIICHGGLVAISAKIVAGHRATGSQGIKDDLVNAGATWVDEPALRDGHIAWGRVVDDIPAFLRETVDLFAEHRTRRS